MSSQIEYKGRAISIPPKPLNPPKVHPQSEKAPKTLLGDIRKVVEVVSLVISRKVKSMKPKVIHGGQILIVLILDFAIFLVTAASNMRITISKAHSAIVKANIPNRTAVLFNAIFNALRITRFIPEHSPRVSARILKWTGIISLFVPLIGLVIAPLALVYSKTIKYRNNKIDYYTDLNTLPLAIYASLLAVAFAVLVFVNVVVLPIVSSLP